MGKAYAVSSKGLLMLEAVGFFCKSLLCCLYNDCICLNLFFASSSALCILLSINMVGDRKAAGVAETNMRNKDMSGVKDAKNIAVMIPDTIYAVAPNDTNIIKR